METLDDASMDQGGFVSPRPVSPSEAASVEVNKVLQEVESVLATVEAEIVSGSEKPRLDSEKEALVPAAEVKLPTLVKTDEAKAAEEKPAEKPKNPSPPAHSTKFVQGAFFGSFQKISVVTVLKQVAPLVAMGIFLGLVGVAAHKLQIDSIAQLLNLDNLQRLSQVQDIAHTPHPSVQTLEAVGCRRAASHPASSIIPADSDRNSEPLDGSSPAKRLCTSPLQAHRLCWTQGSRTLSVRVYCMLTLCVCVCVDRRWRAR